MSWTELLGFSLTLVVMLIGLAGSILPVIPSTPLVMGAAVIHKLIFGDRGAGWLALTLMACFMAFSLIVDYLASMYGAKKLGATWKGIAGALLGGLVGLFFGIVGVLIGPFIGAFLFELMGGRDWKESGKAGLGAFLGLMAGAVGKIACSVAMIGLFAGSVILRWMG